MVSGFNRKKVSSPRPALHVNKMEMLKQNGILELEEDTREECYAEDGIIWLKLGLSLKILCLMTTNEKTLMKLRYLR